MTRGRRRKMPDTWAIPDFGPPEPAGERLRTYRADRTVFRRGRAYVVATLAVELLPRMFGMSAGYALVGRVASPWSRTVDGRANPPLGRTQKVVGAAALLELFGQVRSALAEAGWHPVEVPGIGQDCWQAPEGPELERAAAHREEEETLLALIARAARTVLRGDGMAGADAGKVMMKGTTWRVWAEPSHGGVLVRALPEDRDRDERAQYAADALAADLGYEDPAELARQDAEARAHAETEGDVGWPR